MTQCDSYPNMTIKLRPIQNIHGGWKESPQFVQLKRLAKNEFKVMHRGCTNRKYNSGHINLLEYVLIYQNSRQDLEVSPDL